MSYCNGYCENYKNVTQRGGRGGGGGVSEYFLNDP